MSCYEWESGRFVLPTSEVTGLKAALREHVNVVHAATRTKAVALHKSFQTTSRTRYAERLSAAEQALWSRSGELRDPAAARTDALALAVLRHALHTAPQGKAPTQPTVAMVSVIAPQATNRTEEFCSGEVRIRFDGRVLHYDVPENNRARDRADEDPLVRLLFTRMDRVRWTRGTGGHTVGNDEYNRESTSIGGGRNYLLRGYGPLGEQAGADRSGLAR